MPAMRNEITTDGPASGTASLITKKMPVPTVDPIPKHASCVVVMVRLRPVSASTR